jgi:hypothetical protein
MDEELPSTSLDFEQLFQEAAELFHKQALTSQDKNATLKDIEVARASASSFLDALNNALEVTHLAEMAATRKKEFKRDDELAVMNPMLKSYQAAARLCQKSMDGLVRRLDLAYENFDNLQIAEIKQLQDAYAFAIDNMNTLVTGFSKLLTMQRKTGGLRLGARDTAGAQSITYIKGLEDEGAGKPKQKPRVLSAEEFKNLLPE